MSSLLLDVSLYSYLFVDIIAMRSWTPSTSTSPFTNGIRSCSLPSPLAYGKQANSSKEPSARLTFLCCMISRVTLMMYVLQLPLSLV